MKVDLRKLPKEQKEFSLEYKNGEDFAQFNGSFYGKPPFLVITGNIQGKIKVACDISGEEFFDTLNEDVKIKVVEGIHKGFDEEYDIVENDDSMFDFESFLIGEIELFRNDYHKKEETDEKEFVFENL